VQVNKKETVSEVESKEKVKCDRRHLNCIEKREQKRVLRDKVREEY